MNDKLIREFVRDRDKAVATFDLETFKKFFAKYKAKGIYDIDLPSDDKVIEITMRKMAVNSIRLPIEVRMEAAEWLTDRGYSTILM